MNEFARRRTWGPSPRYPLVEAYDPKNVAQPDFVVITGPCSVENVLQIEELAVMAHALGATHLRGGVFRAGTYPGHKFGYVEEPLIRHFHEVADERGLQNIIEVLDYSEDVLDMLEDKCHAFQVGARAMQNYTLLRKLGVYEKPVFLKRHPGSTLDEWLGAAEHLLTGGVEELYLIERGSSTHMNHVRHDLSLSIIPAIRALTKIPVIVDASHGTGRRDLVSPMTLAGVAAGAGGMLVEVHHDPAKSLSDPDQAITPAEFAKLMRRVTEVRKAIQ